MHAVRQDPELQRFYRRKLIQKGLGKARVAVARKLGIRLWILLRDQIAYNEFCHRGQKQQKSGDACAGMPDAAQGAKQFGGQHRVDERKWAEQVRVTQMNGSDRNRRGFVRRRISIA